MPIRQMILIVLLNSLFTTSSAYAGSCTEYIPKIVSLDTSDPNYLAYEGRWTSVISPLINIANNPVTPLNILSDLSKHKLIDVRMAIAMNPSTPSNIKNALFSDETFRKIFEDNSRFFETSQISSGKYALQEERTIPAVTPSLIAEVKEEIKIGKFNKQSIDVVKNPNLSKKDLEEFCQCKHYPILIRVAANPNITAECIQTLTKDFIKDGKLDLTIAFVKNEKIDLRDRKDYEVYSGRHYVTKSLLKNIATPTSILYSTLDYAKQYYYEDTLLHAAVLALLSRPDVPVNNILSYLIKEEEMLIKPYSLEGSEIDGPMSSSTRGMGLFAEFREVLDKRLDKVQSRTNRVDFMKYAVKSESVILRTYAASSQLTPANLLEQLADDKSLFVRLELSKNNNILADIITKLLKTKELVVFDVRDCSYE